jgi:hypothetical protein
VKEWRCDRYSGCCISMFSLPCVLFATGVSGMVLRDWSFGSLGLCVFCKGSGGWYGSGTVVRDSFHLSRTGFYGETCYYNLLPFYYNKPLGFGRARA